jgi:hypothetical protein
MHESSEAFRARLLNSDGRQLSHCFTSGLDAAMLVLDISMPGMNGLEAAAATWQPATWPVCWSGPSGLSASGVAVENSLEIFQNLIDLRLVACLGITT